jgi:hypothetical protein
MVLLIVVASRLQSKRSTIDFTPKRDAEVCGATCMLIIVRAEQRQCNT